MVSRRSTRDWSYITVESIVRITSMRTSSPSPNDITLLLYTYVNVAKIYQWKPPAATEEYINNDNIFEMSCVGARNRRDVRRCRCWRLFASVDTFFFFIFLSKTIFKDNYIILCRLCMCLYHKTRMRTRDLHNNIIPHIYGVKL